MSIFLSQPQTDTRASFAGGEASWSDIFAAARDAAVYLDNTFAADAAMEEAYERRIAEVKAVTGQELRNPYRTVITMGGPRGGGVQAPIEKRRSDFEQQLQQALAPLPDRTVVERLMRSVDADAIGIARTADADLARLAGSRDGIGKWTALLAGGMGGSLRDPVTVGTLVLGGGPGAARTAIGRILTVAAKEALINGATEAAMQPMVQAWREKVGVDHGFMAAMENVLFASLAGGGLGAIGAGAAEALRPLVRARDVDRAAALAAGDERLAPEIRAALAGEGDRAADSLAPIRQALPPAARGALDQAQELKRLDLSRPAGDGIEAHEGNVTRADAAAQDPETPFLYEADEKRLQLLADRIMPAQADAPKAQSLVAFLQSAGGVLDQAGELKALGAEALAKKPKRRGGKARDADRRMPLDRAREAAAEAGYLDHLYGDAATAMEKSTVADLLSAIDEDLRGNRVMSSADAVDSAFADRLAAERGSTESLLSEILRFAGPAADDDTVLRIAALARAEGIDGAEATVRLLEKDSGGDVPPAEISEGQPDLPEPGRFDEEFEISDAELDEIEAEGIEIPFFDDGPPMSAAQLRAELARGDDMAAVVAACKV